MYLKNSLHGFKNRLFGSFRAFSQELTWNANKIILPDFKWWYSHLWPHGYFYHCPHGCPSSLTVRTEVTKISARFTSVRSLVRVQYRPQKIRAKMLGFFVGDTGLEPVTSRMWTVRWFWPPLSARLMNLGNRGDNGKSNYGVRGVNITSWNLRGLFCFHFKFILEKRP